MTTLTVWRVGHITIKKRRKNIMLVLENVKKENNIIDADFYFPDYKDDEKYRGHIRYDVSAGDYIDIVYSGKERKSRYGFSHITLALQDMVRNDRYPETFTARWY